MYQIAWGDIKMKDLDAYPNVAFTKITLHYIVSSARSITLCY